MTAPEKQTTDLNSEAERQGADPLIPRDRSGEKAGKNPPKDWLQGQVMTHPERTGKPRARVNRDPDAHNLRNAQPKVRPDHGGPKVM